MSNPFLKEFDEIFNNILTDYENQDAEIDISQGSLTFIKSACLASALWGAYKSQKYISEQIHPDTASEADLEHHAWTRDITRRVDESTAELLARVLDDIRQPPAGGNKYDYVKWALEVDGVGKAYCIPLAQGLGTVDVLILASGANETPDQALIDDVYDHIDDVRPVTAHTMRVLAPDVITQAITMIAIGDNIDTAEITADIEAHMNNLIPEQGLTLAQLNTIAVNAGCTDTTITVPAANVTADPDEMIRPGTINVSTT